MWLVWTSNPVLNLHHELNGLDICVFLGLKFLGSDSLTNSYLHFHLFYSRKRKELLYLGSLRWSQLTDRRLYFSLIECYKLVFGLNSLCFCDFFEFASKRTRSNHNYKLQFKLNRRTVIVINIHSLLKLFVNGMTCLPMLLR